MTNQTIYIAYGVNKRNEPMAICWHTDENIAKAYGVEIAKKFEIKFVGVSPCKPIPQIETQTNPEPEDDVTALVAIKIKKLVDYICGLEPDLYTGEAAAIAAILIDGLTEVETLLPNIHNLALTLKQKRRRASVASDN